MISKTHIYVCTILIANLFAIGICAQDYHTISHYHYEFSPGNKYKYDNENNVDVEENEFILSLPIVRDNGDAFVTGFEFNKNRLYPHFNNPDTASDSIYTGSYQFYRYRLVLGYNKVWNENFSGAFTFVPSISSDMEDISIRDFQWGIAFLFTKKSKPTFTLKYGLYLNTDYFGLFVVPLIGWDWKMSEKWRMFGVLPRIMTIQYMAGKRFRTGIKFEAPGYSNRVNKVNFTNAAGEYVGTYVQNLKNALYLYGEVYLTKSLVLQGRVGHSIFRFVRLYDEDVTSPANVWGINVGRKRPRMEVSGFRKFSDGVLLNASINYRFSLE